MKRDTNEGVTSMTAEYQGSIGKSEYMVTLILNSEITRQWESDKSVTMA
jgi:hypothetical protein